MSDVYLARAAFREIQVLLSQDLHKLKDIIVRLSQGDFTYTKKLQGYDPLERTKYNRTDKLRVIWYFLSEDIVIVQVVQRRDAYPRNLRYRQWDNLILWEVIGRSCKKETVKSPIYKWNNEEESNWFKFIYGGYRYSPKLTSHQREIINDLLNSINRYTYNQSIEDIIKYRSLLVQSAPGTGKTVCAALISCELHQKYNFNVFFILPQALCRDVKEYWEVKQILDSQQNETEQQNKNNIFWVGTFGEWLQEFTPELGGRLATPEQEFQALKEILERRHFQEEFSYHDVVLYQAFVLSEALHNQDDNLIYRENKNRIDLLQKKIKPEKWKALLGNYLCRLDIANHLIQNPPSPSQNTNSTIFIIDEAQDYLLEELQAIVDLCKAWQKQNHSTYLWILGDLNQRIQPVNFDWGHLYLGRTTKLLYNYRNSKKILGFAVPFIERAKEINKQNNGSCKIIPEPPKPEYTVEEGETVRLIEYTSKEEAKNFLKQLSEKNIYQKYEDKRSLLRELANEVKILHANLNLDFTNYQGLEFLTTEEAKGREFEACVFFCLFDRQGTELENIYHWYTLITRTRFRLLIVATKSELDRVGRHYFEDCDSTKSESENIQWLTEIAADDDLTKKRERVKTRLLDSFEAKPLCLYWDTYEALQQARIEENELNQLEREAIEILQIMQDTNDLQKELEKTPTSNLHCLILRAMQCSWEAVKEANNLKNNHPEEYERLLENIAQDLEEKGLPYEAARVRTRLDKLDKTFPSNYPFPELAEQEGDLLFLLNQLVS